MLSTIKLLLPALIPSWRFFDTIAPSPRIEFALLKTAEEIPVDWKEFRPRPAQLSAGTVLTRLFWNPAWNETLFLISCAERLMAEPTDHSCQEIAKRIKSDLEQQEMIGKHSPYLQFRLVFVRRQDMMLKKNVTFTSVVYDPSGKSAT